MSDQRTFTNEELTGYLDGEIAADLAEHIRLAATQDAQLALRIGHLQLDTDQIKHAVDTLLDDSPALPDMLSDGLSDRPPRSSVGPARVPIRSLIAASLVFLLLGGALGAYLTSLRGETWQDYAATYHALYVNSTLAHVNRTQSTEKAELQRVSDALGKKLPLDALSDIAQLDYKRAQILGFEGQPIVQLAFLSKIGAPVALCIKRVGHQSKRAVRSVTMRGMSAVTWSKGNYEFLLVGGRDDDVLAKAAEKFAERL
jgi:anti-sigma factor RsiW